ncbi:hypothetical protein ALC57_02344 [Trachymyrmex cornetzi]|uniref:Uncharacterized protein n=1 Tax=Trachymyrmex cornetzi TaxID=471704 RepID=A0A195EJ53_9HYME|nr:hypothetical protein ALC57_02344 [Trachymyrmex cornetzi]
MDPMDSGRRRKPSARLSCTGWSTGWKRKNITTSRVPPYLAAFLEATTTTTRATRATRPGKTTDEISRPLPLTSTAAAVISLPVHATVAGTPRSNKCYQRRCLRPAPKTSQPSRVNDVRPRGGNCPEAMQPPHSSADRATSDPPKPRRDSRT